MEGIVTAFWKLDEDCFPTPLIFKPPYTPKSGMASTLVIMLLERTLLCLIFWRSMDCRVPGSMKLIDLEERDKSKVLESYELDRKKPQKMAVVAHINLYTVSFITFSKRML